MKRELIERVKEQVPFLRERSMHEVATYLSDLDKELKEVSARKKEIEALLKGYMDEENKEYTPGVRRILAEKMTEEGVPSFALDGVGLFSRYEDTKPRVEDKEALLEWMYETGRESMISRSVPWMSLKSLIEELMEDFEELPNGVDPNPVPSVRYKPSR